MEFGPLELIIILVIVVLLFGPGRLGKIAGEVGKGIRSFRENLSGEDEKKDESKDENSPPPPKSES
jgi:sec-independent protein translocase protein TatA